MLSTLLPICEIWKDWTLDVVRSLSRHRRLLYRFYLPSLPLTAATAVQSSVRIHYPQKFLPVRNHETLKYFPPVVCMCGTGLGGEVESKWILLTLGCDSHTNPAHKTLKLNLINNQQAMKDSLCCKHQSKIISLLAFWCLHQSPHQASS